MIPIHVFLRPLIVGEHMPRIGIATEDSPETDPAHDGTDRPLKPDLTARGEPAWSGGVGCAGSPPLPTPNP